MNPGLTITKDGTRKLMQSIAALAGRSVLVGIEDPAVAVYGYIQNYGSPSQNIPATHFLDIGIENAQPAIAANLQAAASDAVSGKGGKVEQFLASAGAAAVREIQAVTPVATGRLRDSVIYKIDGHGQDKQSEEIEQETRKYTGEEGGDTFATAGEEVATEAVEAGEGIASGIAEAGEAALLL